MQQHCKSVFIEQINYKLQQSATRTCINNHSVTPGLRDVNGQSGARSTPHKTPSRTPIKATIDDINQVHATTKHYLSEQRDEAKRRGNSNKTCRKAIKAQLESNVNKEKLSGHGHHKMFYFHQMWAAHGCYY